MYYQRNYILNNLKCVFYGLITPRRLKITFLIIVIFMTAFYKVKIINVTLVLLK